MINDLDNEEEIKEELSESGAKTGIEAEDEELEVLEPFDPDAISISQKAVLMDAVIRRLKQGTIRLAPSFQRNEVWDETRKSRLIESLMLNVPLPMFYVAADEEGRWEVVDGLQRLSTIRDFIVGNENGVHLKLKNLEFLGDKYDGKTFVAIESNLSEQKLINHILEAEMRFTVINPGTPEAVKRNIFKRINTGGMPLTSQEIRHALYEGKSSELLLKLVKSKSFMKATGNRINDSRMGARELILRFLSFLIFERNFYKSSMDSWLSNAMRVINCMPELEDKKLGKIYLKEGIPKIRLKSIEDITEKFELAMLRAEELFDGHAFRKSLPGDYKKSPVNKSLFEVWGNILAFLSDSDYDILFDNRNQFLKKYAVVLNGLDTSNAISRHSSTPKGVMYSYMSIEKLVKDVIRGEEF